MYNISDHIIKLISLTDMSIEIGQILKIIQKDKSHQYV